MSDLKYSKYALRKSFIVTTLFALAGVLATLRIFAWAVSLPLIIFYITLLVNTYFSIRCFFDLVPRKNIKQQSIDLVLGALYLILAASLGNQLLFSYTATILFAMATLKYVLLLPSIGHFTSLKRKIFIDCLGIIACILTLGGVLLGYGLLATWLWAGIFTFANIHLLFIKPMYNYYDSK